jgi:hypothetical protein
MHLLKKRTNKRSEDDGSEKFSISVGVRSALLAYLTVPTPDEAEPALLPFRLATKKMTPIPPVSASLRAKDMLEVCYFLSSATRFFL